jgi:hypothetical protein
MRASAPVGCSPQGLKGVGDSFEGFLAFYVEGCYCARAPMARFGLLSSRLAYGGQAPEPDVRGVKSGSYPSLIVRPLRIL